MTETRRRVLLWLILAGGIALRIGWCWTHRDEFTDDRDGYLAHAQSIASGEGYLGPYSGRPTAFRPPLYPIAIGLLQRSGCSAAVAVVLINGLSSLAVMFLPFWLIHRTSDLFGGSSVLTLSLLLIAFDPLLIRYSSLPMTEVPCAALLISAVTVFSRSLEGNTPQGQVGRQAFFLAGGAGLLFALGALTRPAVLVACPVTALVPVFRQYFCSRRTALPSMQSPEHRWHCIALSMLMLMACGVGMSPWIIRNQIHFDRFVPATTHGGYTLALGNNVDFYRDVIRGDDEFPWNGDALDRWQKRVIQQAADEGIPAESEIANDAWYYQQAMAAIRQDPSAFAQSCVLRVQRFFAVSTADPNMSGALTSMTSIWYVAVWVGLVINSVVLIRRQDEDSRIRNASAVAVSRCTQIMCWTVVTAFVVIHLIFWTDTRMRAPVMPFLAILSATGWCSLQKLCETRYGQDTSINRRSSCDSLG